MPKKQNTFIIIKFIKGKMRGEEGSKLGESPCIYIYNII